MRQPPGSRNHKATYQVTPGGEVVAKLGIMSFLKRYGFLLLSHEPGNVLWEDGTISVLWGDGTMNVLWAAMTMPVLWQDRTMPALQEDRTMPVL